MRRILDVQMPLSSRTIEHPRALDLAKMSELLDALPESTKLVHADLTRQGKRTDTGRDGMTAEQVLRVVLVKQMNQFSYDELAFHLEDSCSLQTFCRLPFGTAHPKATLQGNIARVRADTMLKINGMLVVYAVSLRVESGRKTRTDSTVVETNIHAPTDSSLLWDCVRVLTRLMGNANEEVGSFAYVDHTRRVKKRALGILNARNNEARVPLYRDLIRVTEMTIADAETTATALTEFVRGCVRATSLSHFIKLARQVVDQARRRVLEEETVPSSEKIVSIFETHTDIIVKDRRDTLYGHKIFLTTGASGLVLDVVVKRGNPADTTLAKPMVERVAEALHKMPKQVSFDGGFSSKENVGAIKRLGVEDVAFHKHPGLEVTEMVKSERVMKRLRNFRAGIEAGISWLKRSFGLDRCTWKGWAAFEAYVASSVVACNLLTLARRLLT